jgi:hypothetical protein
MKIFIPKIDFKSTNRKRKNRQKFNLENQNQEFLIFYEK